MITLHRELVRLGIDHDFIPRRDGLHRELGTHIITIYHPYTSIIKLGKMYEINTNKEFKKLNLVNTLKYVLSNRDR